MTMQADELTPTQRKRQQRRRQRERLRRKVAELAGSLTEAKGQRNRARRDRETLAVFIEANVEGAQVSRNNSGRWFVVT